MGAFTCTAFTKEHVAETVSADHGRVEEGRLLIGGRQCKHDHQGIVDAKEGLVSQLDNGLMIGVVGQHTGRFLTP